MHDDIMNLEYVYHSEITDEIENIRLNVKLNQNGVTANITAEVELSHNDIINIINTVQKNTFDNIGVNFVNSKNMIIKDATGEYKLDVLSKNNKAIDAKKI